MKKTKNDIILLLVILLFCALVSIGMIAYNKQETGVRVIVTVDGKEYGSYPLNRDAVV